MKISIKILLGEERPFEVFDTTTVAELKSMVAADFNIPEDNQKLLLNGRPLVDSKTMADYNIQEGAKINVFIRQPTTSVGDSLTALNTVSTGPTLHSLIYKKLLPYFSEVDARKVADEFMRDFRAKMAALSLDDIERLAVQYMEEDIPSE